MSSQPSIRSSIKSNWGLLLSLSIGALLVLLTWVFGLSFWKSISIVLLAVVGLLLFVTSALIDRLEKIEKSRDNRITRIYNRHGQEVLNRWTEQLEEGHWVTITFDVINHEVLYAEHTRTDENTNSLGREPCIQQEHEYNKSSVWGNRYKRARPGFKLRSPLKTRLKNARVQIRT